MVKAKHMPPSRLRYERSHPVVAIRVNRELYNELKELSKKTGKSFADFLKEGAGITKSQIKKTEIRPDCLFCQEPHSELDSCVICRDCYQDYRGEGITGDVQSFMDAWFGLGGRTDK